MFRNLFKELGDPEKFFGTQKSGLRVTPVVSPKQIRDALAEYDFSHPVPLAELSEDIIAYMKKWNVHVPHPGYFGLFNPAATKAAILADTLTAYFNPQLAAWSHAPFANEVEKHTLSFVSGKIGPGCENWFGCFTSGGSEANLTAMLAALAFHFPDYLEQGFAGSPVKPVFYLSAGAHNSFDKICKNVGIGTRSMRIISVDESWKMNVNFLEQQIRKDTRDGFTPFMVIGTAGTTSAGIIDPLPELARLCRENNLWFHVDAAWAGAAVFSSRMNPLFRGMEEADSVTMDAHKWFSVPMGAGMFFSKHKQPLEKAFRIGADYMPEKNPETDDPYTTTIQWSRRFTGLKLFMTLAELGESGIEEKINRFTDLGHYMRKQLKKNGWVILNPTDLPLVCFTHPDLKAHEISESDILESIYNRGNYWISSITLQNGEKAFRACITSFHTNEEHINGLAAELQTILNQLIREKNPRDPSKK